MSSKEIDRQKMDVDIVCVGFGPATAGFLSTLSKNLMNEDGSPAIESKVMPGCPLQVMCYERSDDMGFGVSGIVTKGRGIKASYPDLDPSQIPMATTVKHEKVLYLLDPSGASRRPILMSLADTFIKAFKRMIHYKDYAYELPYIPPFMRKDDGLILSMGQFMQWVGSELMMSGTVQIWPATPVNEPIIEDNKVNGVRLTDQGVDLNGKPAETFLPGMDIHAALTVLGDGPVGAVGRKIDDHFGLPKGNHQRDWAVGMKMVVDLPEGCKLEEGTILHTLGYPEPEIFGFMYVYPNNVASLGIFVPSWFENPVRTAYRYMQHWMMHPYLWKHLEGGTLRSWGAKSLQEAGKRGEPHLAGDGYARIGEGSGSTNVLAGSGVDEAWTTGTQLAEGVLDLLKDDKDFTKENIEEAYVNRRRNSWVENEAKIAKKSRDGFNLGVVTGMIGMGITGITNGFLNIPGRAKPLNKRVPSIEKYYSGRISAAEIQEVRNECKAKGLSLHDALMDRAGWPEIPIDGTLLISHQDALLLGGKVQAADGYGDHVAFSNQELCEDCASKVCIEMCSGQAITTNPDGEVPLFDREKCVHCGACIWNCAKANMDHPEKTNIDFKAGSGGLHSAEN